MHFVLYPISLFKEIYEICQSTVTLNLEQDLIQDLG